VAKNIRALVIVRVSSAGQTDVGGSLEQQTAACDTFCQEQNWQPVHLPRPKNISGTEPWEKRPDLHHALAMYRERKVDRIVFWTSSRKDRNIEVQKRFLREAFEVRHEYDIWIAAKRKQLKTGDLEEDITSVVDTHLAREAFKTGYEKKMHHIANGEWSFGGDMTTGYMRVYNGLQASGRRKCVGVALNPARAPVARNIFRWYASGLGLNVIAHKLDSEGVQSPQAYAGKKGASDHWSQKSVRWILSNEVYIGRLKVWQRPPTRKALEAEFKRDTVIFKVEPLIDMKTWHAVQRRLDDQHARSPRLGNRKNPDGPLQRRVWCSCGALYQMRCTENTQLMQCLACRRAGRQPSRILVQGTPLRRLETTSTHPRPILPLVVKGLRELLANPEKAVEASVKDIDQRIADLSSQLGPATKSIKQLDNAKAQLVKLAAAGVLNDEDFNAKLKTIQDQQAALSRRATRKQAELDELTDLQAQRSRLTKANVAMFVGKLGAGFVDKKDTFGEKSIHELLDALNVRIVVHHDGRVEMSGRIVGELKGSSRSPATSPTIRPCSSAIPHPTPQRRRRSSARSTRRCSSPSWRPTSELCRRAARARGPRP
jgi:hypothetical protein